MPNPLKRVWHTLTTGWVLEYPDPHNGPADFFDRKPGRNAGSNDHAAHARENVQFGSVGWDEEARRDSSRRQSEGLVGDAGGTGESEIERWERERREEDEREEACLRWSAMMREREAEGRTKEVEGTRKRK